MAKEEAKKAAEENRVLIERLSTVEKEKRKAVGDFQSLEKRSQEFWVHAEAKIAKLESELASTMKKRDEAFDEAKELIARLISVQ